MALNVSGTGSDADGKSMAALGAQQAKADHEAAKDNGFEYDSEEMRKQIGELSELRADKFSEFQDIVPSLTGIEGLGDEEVSAGYLEDLNSSGKKYHDVVADIDKYLESYIEALKDIDRKYRESDEDAAEQVRGVSI